MRLSGLRRSERLAEMERQVYDLLVIGGGITGAGIALDAATRGMRTALVEMQDFAAGTSSRSTKLIHGGLRYLKQLEFRLVAEVGRERAIVFANGPHVTTPVRMLLPLYKDGSLGPLAARIGLALYDRLAGVKSEERKRMLSREETLRTEPLLNPDGLRGSGAYVEYRTDDARLTLEVLKAAVAHGADAVNYAEATGLLYDEAGRVIGAMVMDRFSRRPYRLRARKVVNAAGPWVDRIRAMNGTRGTGRGLTLTKGVHLVFDRARFPLRQAVYFDAPDGRMLFAIPREGKTYIGTTDTFYEGDPLRPAVAAEDRDYLLQAADRMFPRLGLTAHDVEAGWAGLRPLIAEPGKPPSAISRKDEIWHDRTGLISIAGGKLTGYRKMAQQIVDMAAEQLTAAGLGPFGPCVTRHLPISGGDVGGAEGFPAYIERAAELGAACGLSREAARRIARRYGSNAERVFAYAERAASLSRPPGLPLEWAAVLLYAVEEEMAVTPTDFWLRRTGALLFDRRAAARWRRPVRELMAFMYGWDTATAEEFDCELAQAIADTSAGNALNDDGIDRHTEPR
jgi:glycerol-3-phosphate dehydrogenase